MPWDETENQIRYRVRNPEDFVEGSFRTITLKGVNGVQMVVGKLKDGDGKMVPQSLRFKKSADWTVQKAKEWVAKHNFEVESACAAVADGVESTFDSDEIAKLRKIFHIIIDSALPEKMEDRGPYYYRKEIIHTGTFVRPDNSDRTIKITKMRLQEWKRKFDEGMRGRVPVTISHPSAPIDYTEKGIGWIEALELAKNSEGKWALFANPMVITNPEWGEKIDRGDVKGVSIGIDPNYKHFETGEDIGEVLDHVAVTNIEHIRDLEDFQRIYMEMMATFTNAGEVFMEENIELAKWTRAYINDLPDSAFAVILPGGKKDEEGKTVPRSLRKLPYKDKDGKIDLPHLRNALARLPLTDMPEEYRRRAERVLKAAAKKAGIGEFREEKMEQETDEQGEVTMAGDTQKIEEVQEPDVQAQLAELQRQIEELRTLLETVIAEQENLVKKTKEDEVEMEKLKAEKAQLEAKLTAEGKSEEKITFEETPEYKKMMAQIQRLEAEQDKLYLEKLQMRFNEIASKKIPPVVRDEWWNLIASERHQVITFEGKDTNKAEKLLEIFSKHPDFVGFEESPKETSEPEGVKVLTFEEWQSLSPQEQRAYKMGERGDFRIEFAKEQ